MNYLHDDPLLPELEEDFTIEMMVKLNQGKDRRNPEQHTD